MKTVPKDPIMCLSFVNTQLRDYYGSLEELCEDFELEREELEARLSSAGYAYDREQNQFR